MGMHGSMQERGVWVNVDFLLLWLHIPLGPLEDFVNM